MNHDRRIEKKEFLSTKHYRKEYLRQALKTHLSTDTPSCDHPSPSSDAMRLTVFIMRSASETAKSRVNPGSSGDGIVGPGS